MSELQGDDNVAALVEVARLAVEDADCAGILLRFGGQGGETLLFRAGQDGEFVPIWRLDELNGHASSQS